MSTFVIVFLVAVVVLGGIALWFCFPRNIFEYDPELDRTNSD